MKKRPVVVPMIFKKHAPRPHPSMAMGNRRKIMGKGQHHNTVQAEIAMQKSGHNVKGEIS